MPLSRRFTPPDPDGPRRLTLGYKSAGWRFFDSDPLLQVRYPRRDHAAPGSGAPPGSRLGVQFVIYFEVWTGRRSRGESPERAPDAARVEREHVARPREGKRIFGVAFSGNPNLRERITRPVIFKRPNQDRCDKSARPGHHVVAPVVDLKAGPLLHRRERDRRVIVRRSSRGSTAPPPRCAFSAGSGFRSRMAQDRRGAGTRTLPPRRFFSSRK